MIINRGLHISSRRHAMHAGSLFCRSTILSVGCPAILCAALTVLFFSFAGPAFADTISNGTDFQFSDTTGDPSAGAILVADQVAPFSLTGESGTVESWVYADSANNPYSVNGGGSITPAMTFVYQINVTSDSGDIASMGAANFGFNQTDVGYYDQTGSQIWPSFVSRDLSGGSDSTVTFSFFDLGGQYSTIGPGQTSAQMVVNTDATTYTNTYVTLQDGSNGPASSYAIYSPMLPTPEPASIVLMVLGLTGLLAVARARRSGRITARTGCEMMPS